MRKTILLLLLIIALWPPETSAGSKKYRTDYDHYFKKYGKRYFGMDFDWRWFKAQAIAESGLNEKAESWVKAKGLMQLMPATFEEIRKKSRDFSESDIEEPRWNIAAGIYYDRQMWNTWKIVEPDTERLCFTFASYNAGAGTLKKAQERAKKKGLIGTLWDSIVEIAPEVPRWRHWETLGYVEKIKGLVEEVDK